MSGLPQMIQSGLAGRWHNQQALVMGLGASGVAAAELLHRGGATVCAVDNGDNPALQKQAGLLRQQGIEVQLGVKEAPERAFHLAVVSPGVPNAGRMVQGVLRNGVPLIGELELGCQCLSLPSVAITGTNGKTTTTELTERVFLASGLKSVAVGNIGLPVCRAVLDGGDYDWLTLEVSSFQLETIRTFRPTVAVMMNLTPDHLDRYPDMASYIRAKARIFMNQQMFDWAVVQLEAWRQMQALDIVLRGRMITFSAQDSTADLYLERTVIHSRVPGWPSVLMDMAQGQLQGPHNAENLMAVLAASQIVQLPGDKAIGALTSYKPAPHRCEYVAEINGVRFVNDSKATNVDAVEKALLTMPVGTQPGPNIWLIAGGKDKGFEFNGMDRVLSQRVKGAVLIGETREKIRAAWGRFTPCTAADSLLEAVTEAARRAVPGDVILLSPACSSFDMFQNYQHRGEVFREAVRAWSQGGGK